MQRTYDLIIVGAGPAGLMAAKAAGEEGLKTALLERKKDISKIHRSCGGVLNINEPTFGEVVRFNDEKNTITFSQSGFSIYYDGPHQDVYGFQVYSPGGLRLEFGDFAQLRKNPEENRLGVAVSKGQLLSDLLVQVEKLGVDVFHNTNVCSVKKNKDSVEVLIEDDSSFKGSMVVAADGINSRIARFMGVNRGRDFFGTSRDTSMMIEGTDCPDPDGFLFMFTPKGVFSMIPVAEKNCYHIYASTFQCDVKPIDLLEYFVYQDPTFSPWYKNSKILKHRTACVVNLMSPIQKPFVDNVLFIGDACWRREMSNVGSMCTGWKAGKTIAKALDDGMPNEEGVMEYLEWYQENYYGPKGDRKQGGRDFSNYLTPDDLDYLVKLSDETFPQTMDIFKVVNCIGKTYAELFPRIYEEKPDVMDRMMLVRENMEDDMKQRISWGFRNA
jgi:flavin-dependent dehydrogenase